jgi:hypothetical protein
MRSEANLPEEGLRAARSTRGVLRIGHLNARHDDASRKGSAHVQKATVTIPGTRVVIACCQLRSMGWSVIPPMNTCTVRTIEQLHAHMLACVPQRMGSVASVQHNGHISAMMKISHNEQAKKSLTINISSDMDQFALGLVIWL